jgi:hypothetical protein
MSGQRILVLMMIIVQPGQRARGQSAKAEQEQDGNKSPHDSDSLATIEPKVKASYSNNDICRDPPASLSMIPSASRVSSFSPALTCAALFTTLPPFFIVVIE